MRKRPVVYAERFSLGASSSDSEPFLLLIITLQYLVFLARTRGHPKLLYTEMYPHGRH